MEGGGGGSAQTDTQISCYFYKRIKASLKVSVHGPINSDLINITCLTFKVIEFCNDEGRARILRDKTMGNNPNHVWVLA